MLVCLLNYVFDSQALACTGIVSVALWALEVATREAYEYRRVTGKWTLTLDCEEDFLNVKGLTVPELSGFDWLYIYHVNWALTAYQPEAQSHVYMTAFGPFQITTWWFRSHSSSPPALLLGGQGSYESDAGAKAKPPHCGETWKGARVVNPG